MAAHPAAGTANALGDDAQLATERGEDRQELVGFAEVDALEDDGRGPVDPRCAHASDCRYPARMQSVPRRRWGRSELSIPVIPMGTTSFGNVFGPPHEEETALLVRRAIEFGV